MSSDIGWDNIAGNGAEKQSQKMINTNHADNKSCKIIHWPYFYGFMCLVADSITQIQCI